MASSADDQLSAELRAWKIALKCVSTPSASDLASTQLLLSLPVEDTASYKQLLEVIMDASLRWKRAELWSKAISRWSTTRSLRSEVPQSQAVLRALRVFGFDSVRDGLERMLGTAANGTLAFRLTEELEDILEAAAKEANAATIDSHVLAWLSKHRARLSRGFILAPDNASEADQILHHCLCSGGLSFMLVHLPVLTKMSPPQSLHELATRIHAESALPESSPRKSRLVSNLLRTAVRKSQDLLQAQCADPIHHPSSLLHRSSARSQDLRADTSTLSIIKPILITCCKMGFADIVQDLLRTMTQSLRSPSEYRGALDCVVQYAVPLLCLLRDSPAAASAIELIQDALDEMQLAICDVHLDFFKKSTSDNDALRRECQPYTTRSLVDALDPLLRTDNGLRVLLKRAAKRIAETSFPPAALFDLLVEYRSRNVGQITQAPEDVKALWSSLFASFTQRIKIAGMRDAFHVMQRCARKFGKDDPIQPIAQRIAKDSSFVSQVDDLSPTPYDGKNKKITLSARSLVDSSANIRSHYPLFELVRQHCSSAATPFASSLRTLLQTWIDSVPEGPQEDVRDLKKKIGDLVKRWNCMRPACVTARRGILLHCLSTDARKSSMHNISGIGRKVISHLKTDMSIYVPRHIATCKTISESTVQVELVGDFKAQRIWQNRRLLAKALLDSWSSQRSLLEEIVGTERLRKLVSWSNDAQPPTQSPEEPAEQHISEDEQDDEQGEEQDDEQDDQDENSESQGHGEGRDMQMENSEEEAVAEGTENTDAVGAGHDRAGEVSGAVATPSKRTSDTSEGQGQDHDGQVAKRPKTESTSTKQYFIKHATGAAV